MNSTQSATGLLQAGSKAPWDLSLMPNYDQAMRIDTVSADQISQREFYRCYVAQNRPCLLMGTARHWPAFSRWGAIDYLKEAAGNDVLRARRAPEAEFGAGDAQANALPFHEFLSAKG